MPYNGTGVFTRLFSWVSERNAGHNISSTDMDSELDGLASGLSNAITRDGQTTITADTPWNSKKITGLGAASANGDALNLGTANGLYLPATGAADWDAAVTVASATTTDIGGAASNFVIVSGSATITSFGSGASGAYRVVKFTGAALITNGSSIVLHGATNIQAVAGDTAMFVAEGVGVWRCWFYVRGDGSVVAAGTTASTSTATGALRVAGGAGIGGDLNWGGAGYTSFTPTIGASGGSGTFTASGFYKRFGKGVHCAITVTITAIGTASGRLQATLPVSAASGAAWPNGSINATTLKGLTAIPSYDLDTKVTVVNVDGNFPGTTGDTLYISCFYQGV